MECEICYSDYDHSLHKPYMLSCPHTFCLGCINKLTANKCPTCNAEIFIKNPNIELLKIILPSLYDQLKASSEKALIEISEYKNDIENKGKAKLSKYCETLNSVKENIKNETNRIIQLVKKNEEKLLNETIEIEKYLKENLCLSEPELNEMRALVVKKILIEANSFSEEHLVDLVEKTDRIKIKLKEAENKIEYFNENISLSFNENALLIGEIQTNKKKFENFTKLAKSSKNAEEIIDLIDKAIEVCPNKMNPLLLKADTLDSTFHFAESLKFYQLCIEQDSSDIRFYEKKVENMLFLEKYEEALIEINKALMLDSNHAACINLKGNIYMKLKDYPNALNSYNRAIELCRSDYYLVSKGKCLKHLNKIDEAIKCCEEVLISYQADKRSQIYANAYLLKSECLYEKKDFKSALNAIDKASEIMSNFILFVDNKIHILRGKIYMEMKDYRSALDCLNKTNVLSNLNYDYLVLKVTCFKHLNQMDEAIRCCERANIVNGKEERAYFLKSECFYEIKSYEEALDAINKALEIKPSFLPYEDLKNNILRDQINYYIITNGLKTLL